MYATVTHCLLLTALAAASGQPDARPTHVYWTEVQPASFRSRCYHLGVLRLSVLSAKPRFTFLAAERQRRVTGANFYTCTGAAERKK